MQKNLVINEKRFVEEIISSTTLSEDISGNNAINYMTRYYTEYTDLSLEEITKKVCDKMESFNLSITAYQPYKANTRIKRIYEAVKLDKLNKLRDYDIIPLYKSEFNKIMTCSNDREKKVLFTLYILARYTNRFGWVYQPESDIYKLANVSTTTKNKSNVFYSLLQNELIKDTKKVDDLKVGVELSDGDEEVVLEVNEIKNLGNLFLASISDKHKQCECCGKMIKLKNNKQKYCKKCASNISSYNPIGYKIIFCKDCGSEVYINSRNTKTIRCDKCQILFENNNRMQKYYAQRKYEGYIVTFEGVEYLCEEPVGIDLSNGYYIENVIPPDEDSRDLKYPYIISITSGDSKYYLKKAMRITLM